MKEKAEHRNSEVIQCGPLGYLLPALMIGAVGAAFVGLLAYTLECTSAKTQGKDRKSCGGPGKWLFQYCIPVQVGGDAKSVPVFKWIETQKSR